MDRAVGSGTTSLLGGDGIGGQDDERADTMSGGSGDDGLGGGSGDDDLIGAAGEDIADGDGDVDFCDAETETFCELWGRRLEGGPDGEGRSSRLVAACP